jgi:hypothetical protein
VEGKLALEIGSEDQRSFSLTVAPKSCFNLLQNLPPLLIAILPATAKIELDGFRIIALIKTGFEFH